MLEENKKNTDTSKIQGGNSNYDSKEDSKTIPDKNKTSNCGILNWYKELIGNKNYILPDNLSIEIRNNHKLQLPDYDVGHNSDTAWYYKKAGIYKTKISDCKVTLNDKECIINYYFDLCDPYEDNEKKSRIRRDLTEGCCSFFATKGYEKTLKLLKDQLCISENYFDPTELVGKDAKIKIDDCDEKIDDEDTLYRDMSMIDIEFNQKNQRGKNKRFSKSLNFGVDNWYKEIIGNKDSNILRKYNITLSSNKHSNFGINEYLFCDGSSNNYYEDGVYDATITSCEIIFNNEDCRVMYFLSQNSPEKSEDPGMEFGTILYSCGDETKRNSIERLKKLFGFDDDYFNPTALIGKEVHVVVGNYKTEDEYFYADIIP